MGGAAPKRTALFEPLYVKIRAIKKSLLNTALLNRGIYGQLVQELYHSSLCRYFNKCRYCFTLQKYKEIPYIILLCLIF